MAHLSVDENGFPMLLADVPNSGAATVDPDAKSGNPQHDTNSGKFAKGSAQGDPVDEIPANVDRQSYLRQMDAVRDLAREMDDFEIGDVAEFLNGRSQRPLEEAELQEFVALVREQRVNDLVDFFDYQFRNLIESIKRGRRRVQVKAPKGWIRKTFNSLTDDEVLSVINRLEARGHKREDLQRSILGRVRKQSRAQEIGARLADIPENDDSLELSGFVPTSESDLEDEEMQETLSEILDKINNNGHEEQPIVVNVNVENKPMRKVVKRDPKTGFIETIEEVEA